MKPKSRRDSGVESVSPQLIERMDAYWRAANYLSVGQIYLYENPLLNCSVIGAPRQG